MIVEKFTTAVVHRSTRRGKNDEEREERIFLTDPRRWRDANRIYGRSRDNPERTTSLIIDSVEAVVAKRIARVPC